MRLRDLFQLNEAPNQNYDEMFNPIRWFVKNRGSEFTFRAPHLLDMLEQKWAEAIRFAKDVLKRKDRTTWYLRIKRADIVENTFMQWMESADLAALKAKLQQAAGSTYTDWGNLEGNLKHFMGTPAEGIQNYVFNRQSPTQVWADLRVAEKAWQATREGMVDENHDEIIHDFKNGWCWVLLNRWKCEEESDAMGHCGNRYGHYGDRILSLRKKQKNGQWRPSLTFIWDKNGYLGETKGRENEKPDEKYHPMIVTLLEMDMIKGIKGGGHDAPNNFEISDLDETQRERLVTTKPELLPLPFYFKRFGADERFRQMALSVVKDTNSNYDNNQWVEDAPGKWLMVFRTRKDWCDLLDDFCDSHVDNLIKAYKGDYDFDVDTYEGWLKNTADDFPQLYIDKMIEYAAQEHGDEIIEWVNDNKHMDAEEIDDITEDHFFEYLEDEEEPDDLYQAIFYAYEGGTSAGRHDNISEKINGLKDDLEYYVVRETEDGKAQACLTPETLCSLMEDGDMTVFYEDEIQPSRISCDGDRDYEGYDRDSAFLTYLDHVPDEAKPELPTLKHTEQMSEEELAAEYAALSNGSDITRYSRDIKGYRATVERTRKRKYGIENPKEAS